MSEPTADQKPQASPRPPQNLAFAYQAQGSGNQTFSGTIDAHDIASAAEKLKSLRIAYTSLEPVARPPRARPFGPADFLAFNRQLGQLTRAGLPIERTLRLMALELGAPQARAVERIAAEMEKGTPIGEAFAAQKKVFPQLYGVLLEAGVRTNNLPGMLLNIGRHVETVQRLRAAVWRAASYPLTVMFALAGVLAFFWFYLLPQFDALSLGVTSTRLMFWRYQPANSPPDIAWMQVVARDLSGAMLIGVVALLVVILAMLVLSRLSGGKPLIETLAYPLPLIGPILRWNLLARWCDALQLCVGAGMDLPAALQLTGNVVDSPGLRKSSEALAAAVSAGRPMDATPLAGFMPALIPTTLQLAAEKNDLDSAAAALATLYREQAELRLAILPQVLSPILLALTAVGVALAILATLLPVFTWLRFLSF